MENLERTEDDYNRILSELNDIETTYGKPPTLKPEPESAKDKKGKEMKKREAKWKRS